MTTPSQLIINSPFTEPTEHWVHDREAKSFYRKDERRPAGYVIASEDSKAHDDPGIFVPIPLVNRIRPRVAAWREAGYPGATGTTRRLLEHWQDPEERRDRRFFFCQLEAIETLIWLIEAPESDRQGIDIPSDGGEFRRLCCKMATGSGKTIVMAMLIAWQVLNKVTSPQDRRFARHVFIVAPGLTVKSRLGVLVPESEGNYYDEFNVVPVGLTDALRQGMVKIENWHQLAWDTPEKIAKRRSVDKRGAKSDARYLRDVLGEMAKANGIIVINDEAHHAWREGAGGKMAAASKGEKDEATVWVGGLDRINAAMRSRGQMVQGIQNCFDFSATPFVPGRKAKDDTLFGWIVSDFGLNDAIESGLVKTPRIVVRDDAAPDAKTYKSKLYHIYGQEEVKDDLSRKAEPEEGLPDLVTNAYHLLGVDWKQTADLWKKGGAVVPPVMITVANRTETAARIKYAFDHERIQVPELCDPLRTLHIDSKVLDEAEKQTEAAEVAVESGDADEDGGDDDDAPKKKLTKGQQAELLRQTVDTVGKPGMPGEKIQNVISVNMLSEGWDCKTVTHIMGLRAFTSQLLCEQVVGRGLRRTSYDAYEDAQGRVMYRPEYVNVFGVPFAFMPHERLDEGVVSAPEAPPTFISVVQSKPELEISWPNVLRIDYVFRPRLVMPLENVPMLRLNAADVMQIAEIAPTIDGKPNLSGITEIRLRELAERQRFGRIAFQTAVEVYQKMKPGWKGTDEILIAQVIELADRLLRSDRIVIEPPLFNNDEMRRRVVCTLKMQTIIDHMWQAIVQQNHEDIEPVFDSDHPVRSTGEMRPWQTRRPNDPTKKSHVSHVVYDSTWESTATFALEHSDAVAAWVKNDHIGFVVHYVHKGSRRKYTPDFLVRLSNGHMLVLEIKGEPGDISKAKHHAMQQWIKAVNHHGGFGTWHFAEAKNPAEVTGVVEKLV